MGPLTLADFIGLDVCLDIMRVLYAGLGDPKYRPCPLLIKMVDAGWLGRKSGRVFISTRQEAWAVGMTTAWDGCCRRRSARKQRLGFYIAAAAAGVFAGWVDLKVGDLLFTALLVLARA